MFPQGDRLYHTVGPAALSDDQAAVLELGLNFIPRQRIRDFPKLMNRELANFGNALYWKDFWASRPGDGPPPPLYNKKPSVTPFKSEPNPAILHWLASLRRRHDRILSSRPPPRLSPRDSLPWKAARQLMRSTDMLIKPADKNLGPCAVHISWYNQQVRLHLFSPSYAPLPTFSKEEYARLPRRFLDGLPADARYEKWILDWLADHPTCVSPDKIRVPAFYLTPKIHKAPYASRPIVQSVAWVSTPHSSLLSHFLTRLVDRYAGEFVLKDSFSLTKMLAALPPPPPGTRYFVATADVEAMYPSITRLQATQGLQYLVDMDRLGPSPLLSAQAASLLPVLLAFIFETMVIEESTFGYFEQLVGLAMGSSFSAAAANGSLFAYEHRSRALIRSTCALYKRFLDDVVVVVAAPEGTVPPPFPTLDVFPPNLRLAWSPYGDSANYLDLHVEVRSGPPPASPPLLLESVPEESLHVHLQPLLLPADSRLRPGTHMHGADPLPQAVPDRDRLPARRFHVQAAPGAAGVPAQRVHAVH